MSDDRELELIRGIAQMVKAGNRTLEESIANMERIRDSIRETRERLEPKPRPNLTLVKGGKEGTDA
jgi:hypothetical protein